MELMEINRHKVDYQPASRFACESSGEKTAVVTDTELIIIKYKPFMDNDENNFTFDEFYIHCSDYHVANQTDIPIGTLILALTKNQFYRLVMNEIFTPEIENANPHVTKPIEAHWSPPRVYRNSEPLLGVVSNTGNVEILLRRHGDWQSFANLTENLVDRNKEAWVKDISEKPADEQCKIHEERVLQNIASCMEWSPVYETDISVDLYVIVGHFTGNVTIWKINCQNVENVEKIEPKFVTQFKVSPHKITAVHWCPVTKNSAWIVVGDMEGSVKAYSFSFPEADIFEMKNTIDIWEDEDIQSHKIFSIKQNDNTLIIVVKGSYLLLSLLDFANNSVKWMELVNLGNLYITGLEKISPNHYMVSLFTGVLKTIEFNISGTKCTYTVKELKNDVNWEIHGTHGLLKLPNSYVWGILIYPCKMFDHLSNRKPLEISFCTTAKFDPGKCLKENPSQSLEKYWEVLDIIRCTSAMKNTLPCNWLANIEKYDDVSLYEIRIMFWLATASHRILLLNLKTKKLNIRAPSPDALEQIIYLKYILNRLKNLVNMHESGKELTAHQLESIYMLKHSIVALQKDLGCEKYFEDKFIKDVRALIEKADKIKEVTVPDCIVCKILNGKCTQKHIEQRCTISYVQLVFVAKWHCPLCRGLAHEDIEDENPNCPLCDVPFLPYDPESD